MEEKNKKIYNTLMDKKLMERIRWSEEEIASYISSYSNFEEEEEEQQQQQKKPRNLYKTRVQKVEVPATTAKMKVKKEKAEKKEDAAVVIEDV